MSKTKKSPYPENQSLFPASSGPAIRFLRDNNLHQTVDQLNEMLLALENLDAKELRRLRVKMKMYHRSTKIRPDSEQMTLMGQFFD